MLKPDFEEHPVGKDESAEYAEAVKPRELKLELTEAPPKTLTLFVG